MAAIFETTFSVIFLSENCCTLIEISLKFVSHGPINNVLVLAQMMAWRRSDNKPLSEPIMAKFNYAYMRQSASVI